MGTFDDGSRILVRAWIISDALTLNLQPESNTSQTFLNNLILIPPPPSLLLKKEL